MVHVFETPGSHSFTAPQAGTVTIEAFGAGGGAGGAGGTGGATLGGGAGSPGAGGKVTASFVVAAGEVLQIRVGAVGGDGIDGDDCTAGGALYGEGADGGGTGAANGGGGSGGGGGGDGQTASGAGGSGRPAQTAFGPPGAVFVPNQRFGNGKVTVRFTPA